MERGLEPATLEEQLKPWKERGITSVAVAFAHSYLWPDHEIQVGSKKNSQKFIKWLSPEQGVLMPALGWVLITSIDHLFKETN